MVNAHRGLLEAGHAPITMAFLVMVTLGACVMVRDRVIDSVTLGESVVSISKYQTSWFVLSAHDDRSLDLKCDILIKHNGVEVARATVDKGYKYCGLLGPESAYIVDGKNGVVYFSEGKTQETKGRLIGTYLLFTESGLVLRTEGQLSVLTPTGDLHPITSPLAVTALTALEDPNPHGGLVARRFDLLSGAIGEEGKRPIPPA